MSLPKKSTKEKSQVVRYENWINQDTGEVRQFAVVDKPYSSDFNFHKVWIEDLAKVLNVIGGKKIEIFNHILRNINPYNNEVGFTYREIADELDVSKTTINETVIALIKADFMRKVRQSQYKINPRMLVKGSHNKRVGIMLKYDDLNDGRQLGMFESDAEQEWRELGGK